MGGVVGDGNEENELKGGRWNDLDGGASLDNDPFEETCFINCRTSCTETTLPNDAAEVMGETHEVEEEEEERALLILEYQKSKPYFVSRAIHRVPRYLALQIVVWKAFLLAPFHPFEVKDSACFSTKDPILLFASSCISCCSSPFLWTSSHAFEDLSVRVFCLR